MRPVLTPQAEPTQGHRPKSRCLSIHNGPLSAEAHTLGHDDTRLITNLDNGYIQNVVQRYVLGVEGFGAISYECGLMQNFLQFPKINLQQPTLREANDNSLYLANNMMKVASGNAPDGFGDVTYVLNTNRVRDFVLVVPFDSGAYFNSCFNKYPAVGTLDHFDHVLMAHFDCGKDECCNRGLQPPYSLGRLMQRWYGGATALPDIYTEMELMANAYVPELLSYVNAYAHSMWATETAHKLSLWSTHHNRPVIWGDGDTSGMLIDPVIGQVNGTYITDEMKVFWRSYSGRPYSAAMWSQLYAQAPPQLKFHLPDWYHSRVLCQEQEAAGLTVLGRNEAGDCVFLNKDPKLPTQAFECKNDGTCAPTTATSSGSTYSTQSECETYCNSGWMCQKNDQDFVIAPPRPERGSLRTHVCTERVHRGLHQLGRLRKRLRAVEHSRHDRGGARGGGAGRAGRARCAGHA